VGRFLPWYVFGFANACSALQRGFALAEDLVSLLKNVQIQYSLAVSLGSLIRRQLL
jgi:hypothetical protein